MTNKLKNMNKTKSLLIDIGLGLIFTALNIAAFELFSLGFSLLAACGVLAVFYAFSVKLYGGSFIKTSFIQLGGYAFCVIVLWIIFGCINTSIDSSLRNLGKIAGLTFLVFYIIIFVLSLIFGRIYLFVLSRVIHNNVKNKNSK